MRMSAAIEPTLSHAKPCKLSGEKRRYAWPFFQNTDPLTPLTRLLGTRIMARVMGDMTKHQREASV
jgi:hypothetical protein